MPTKKGNKAAINKTLPIFFKACDLVKNPKINPKAINTIISGAIIMRSQSRKTNKINRHNKLGNHERNYVTKELKKQ